MRVFFTTKARGGSINCRCHKSGKLPSPSFALFRERRKLVISEHFSPESKRNMTPGKRKKCLMRSRHASSQKQICKAFYFHFWPPSLFLLLSLSSSLSKAIKSVFHSNSINFVSPRGQHKNAKKVFFTKQLELRVVMTSNFARPQKNPSSERKKERNTRTKWAK